MRGSREANGSWKTICISRRSPRISLRVSSVSSVPLYLTEPEVGSMRRRMQRPTVDLPDPDSPTRPRVCPAPTAKETPLTAWTWWCTTFTPASSLTGKFLTRSVTSRIGTGTTPLPDSAARLASLTSAAFAASRRSSALAHGATPMAPAATSSAARRQAVSTAPKAIQVGRRVRRRRSPARAGSARGRRIRTAGRACSAARPGSASASGGRSRAASRAARRCTGASVGGRRRGPAPLGAYGRRTSPARGRRCGRRPRGRG